MSNHRRPKDGDQHNQVQTNVERQPGNIPNYIFAFYQISAIPTIMSKLELGDLSSLSFHRQIFASLNTSLLIFHLKYSNEKQPIIFHPENI